MGLIDDILIELEDKPADKIVLGSTFASVKIGERIGVAHRVDVAQSSPEIPRIRPGTAIAHLALSENLLEAAIGTAAINAQLSPQETKIGNIFKKISDIAKNYKNIGVVGKFPFIRKLKDFGSNIYAFEKKSIPGFYTPEQTKKILPKCDLVLITGTAFVNKTLEQLLNQSGGFTIILGPTTPLSSILFDYGADILAGIIANDDKVLDIVTSGGGTREIKNIVEQVYIEAK
jgi:uncharacterized protein (DUF4213/DUF364 family)